MNAPKQSLFQTRALALSLGLLACALGGRNLLAQDSTPPEIAITSPTNGAALAALGTVTGWATDDSGTVTNVSLLLHELDPSGGAGRFWDGTNWVVDPFPLATVLADTNWSKTASVALPPLNSGLSYEITATALDGSSNAAATTITIQKSADVLTWDPGLTHLGTFVKTNPHTLGGAFIYKIITSASAVGGWRTALTVTSGEANIYLRKGLPPTTTTFDFSSTAFGSDGWVLHSSQFAESEEWFYLVVASVGSTWTLVSGEPYVMDLGPLPAPAASGDSPVTMGAEGYRFFRTTTPAGVLAWRLWLHGATNTLFVKQAFIPLTGQAEKQQDRQMLVIPDYLAGATPYFVGVPGPPGQSFTFHSKQQPITDIAFNSTSSSIVVTGYPYSTYRVAVPIHQIAYQVRTTPSAGDPNVALRRGKVPNEFDNDAFSDVPGAVEDSFTLVPPTLSDGTFYITVYSEGSHTFTLFNGEPPITPRAYIGTTTNNLPGLVGWRFYVVSDIGSQIGTLGWQLELFNHVTGTELALRRNAVPGRWNYRANGVTYAVGHTDVSSTAGFLQRPGHQADIWYIGVYQAATNLGPFRLVTSALTAAPLGFTNNTTAVSGLAQGRWTYYRIDVPDEMQGWDLRLTNVTSGEPQFAVRRDLLPDSLGGWTFGSTWPSGLQVGPGADWTYLSYNPDGSNNAGRLLAVGRDNMLQAGTYYVGVRSDNGPASFTLHSRGIGTNHVIGVSNLNFSGAGSVAGNTLPPREAAYYRIVSPAGVPNWLLRLTPTAGEAMLAVQRDVLPNIAVGAVANAHNYYGKRLQKLGREWFLLLPDEGQAVLGSETNFLAVISEGVGPDYTSSRIGSNVTTYVLESLGSLAVTALGSGALPAVGGGALTASVSMEGGQVILRQFTVPTNIPAMQVRILSPVGAPSMTLRPGTNAAYPHVPASSGENYGADGGWSSGRLEAPEILTIASPEPGPWAVTFKAEDSAGGYPDASCDVEIVALAPSGLAFDGGTAAVAGQQPKRWRYYQVNVPAEALGWDLRLVGVSAGAPRLYVRNDRLPDDVTGGLSAGGDWTGRSRNADDSDNDGRLIVQGMGNPLTAGTNYVGVYNDGPADADYTLQSRGIGDGFIIGITNLNYTGTGSAHTNTTGLPAREAAYYRFVMPSNAPSWLLRVTPDPDGELLLVLRPEVIPPSYGDPWSRVLHKVGKEHYALFPTDGEAFLTPGTNYFVVPSEGIAPVDGSHVGAGSVTYRIESFGPVPIVDLGTLSDTGPPISQHVALEFAEVAVFRFSTTNLIPAIELRLTNRVNNPVLAVRAGTNVPVPQVPYLGPYYGVGGGYGGERSENAELITLANPPVGPRTLTVFAMEGVGGPTNAECDLTITPRGPTVLGFDGASEAVSDQLAQTWRFFRITVPTNAEGWDLRVTGVTGGNARLSVRRDTLPEDSAPGAWIHDVAWPSGSQITAGPDWTGWNESDGSTAYGHYLSFGRHNPLEPGTYYLGIFNDHLATAVSYTLTSRGIGGPYSIPITPLVFNGGTTPPALAPRDVAYFKLEVPTNVPSWRVRLDTAAGGDARLFIRKDRVPNIWTGSYGNAADASGKYLAKPGNEHYVLLPRDGETNVDGGTYYLAVISEGINPGPNIGSGSSTFTLESHGVLPVADLGVVPGLGSMISNYVTLEGGETKAFRFGATGGVDWIELRLDGRIGNPGMAHRPGAETPFPNVPSFNNTYGADGGYFSGRREAFTLLTLVRPDPTNALTVKGEFFGAGYPDAEAAIEIERKTPVSLAFSNGIVSGALADDQRMFYRVIVPADHIGWQLALFPSNGTPTLRVRKDLLPADGEPVMGFGGPTVLITPPFLEAGTWYVEVRGGGATEYTLTSNPIFLDRPPWDMPADGAPVTTPGLPASGPVFADTGVGTNGVPLPGDQGTDLGNGDFHYYSFNVPTGNLGLLRTELLAISANPDLYLRNGGVPTFDHLEFGTSGRSLVDYQLTGTGSEYGNFVPLDGRTETQLGPGQWYVSVRANGSNVRYRLKLSVGTMTNLASGTTLAGQVIPGGDWRYYRIAVPSNAPQTFTVTFSQQQGDVEMFVRDTIPPGEPYDWPVGYRRWGRDGKNGGPYPDFPDPGTYALNVPPVRPGTAYYLGFHALNDAAFTVGVTFSPALIDVTNVVNFYGGTTTVTVPAFGTVKFRVPVPPEATTWRHSNSHPASVWLYLDQGTLPDLGSPGYAIWNSSGLPDSQLIQYLYGWPWVPSQTYFFTATNTSGAAQSLTIRMDGRNAATDDTDGDGLPDGWEILYFGDLNQNQFGDPDGDGVDNATELAEGTNPNNAASFRPRLTVSTVGAGSVVVEPDLPSYTLGQAVTLTAAPDPGQFFNAWTGSVTNIANPLLLTMNGHKSVTANFSGTALVVVFTNLNLTGGGNLAFTVIGPSASALVLHASDNLSAWSPLATNAPFTGTFDYEDASTAALSRRYYRAELRP